MADIDTDLGDTQEDCDEMNEDRPLTVEDDELVDAWETKHKIYHYETTTKNLERLIETIGYLSIDDFLDDNPGAQAAIRDFIAEWVPRSNEWSTQLRVDIEAKE